MAGLPHSHGHICSRIRRQGAREDPTGGIRVFKNTWRKINGVFLSPQTEDYSQTHQWYREIQRHKNVPKLVARVRIPDDETVWVGIYNKEHLERTAAEAIGMAREHREPDGLEVILPRAVQASEILKFIDLPKAVGWRYQPGSNGKKTLRLLLLPTRRTGRAQNP